MASSEIGLLSDRTVLDFGMALLTAVLIAVTIKSAYFSTSLVDRCPEKSAEPSAPRVLIRILLGLVKFVLGVVSKSS